ncbi:MAG: twin-arginine translocase TatA/TatE family subunit [Porticoccaceae bacterium]
MGLGGISIWQLLIILAIVVLIFGTKRLKGIGGDLGGAIKSFRKAVTDEETAANKDDKGPDQLDQQKTSDEGATRTEKTETRQP